MSVSALTITVTASVTLEDSASEEVVQLDMEAALGQLFDSLTVGAGETIRYNRVLAILLSLPGRGGLRIHDAQRREKQCGAHHRAGAAVGAP